MILELINRSFSICKLSDAVDIDLNDEFVFIGKTDEELSLVCLTEKVPANTSERDDGWRALRIKGMLDFSLVGIISGVTSLLSAEKIPLFAVSTYNTDYILIKEAYIDNALSVLASGGYVMEEM